jgi:hypothetical protein
LNLVIDGVGLKRKFEQSGMESGWNDMVRADPGLITRIIIPIESPAATCGIVTFCSRKENEMMGPYQVVSAAEHRDCLPHAGVFRLSFGLARITLVVLGVPKAVSQLT